jgi:hypothetical protein
MNWFSSVIARNMAMRASKCAPEPNSICSCEPSIQWTYRHEAGNPEVTSDIEHPESASCFSELDLKITDVRGHQTD